MEKEELFWVVSLEFEHSGEDSLCKTIEEKERAILCYKDYLLKNHEKGQIIIHEYNTHDYKKEDLESTYFFDFLFDAEKNIVQIINF